MHNIRRVIGPSASALTIQELKVHTRSDAEDDDGYLAGLIKAAVDYVDGYSGVLGRALITQTWSADMDAFRPFKIPLGPNIAITAINYYDTDNMQQPFTGYELQEDCVQLAHNESWPDTYPRADAVTVTWTCGFGDSWNDIPESIRLGMMHLVAHWYEQREAAGTSMAPAPMTALKILAPHRAVV